MKKPNFIISGFPKCGTTSLHHYLNEHPQIFMPSQKELHFFTFKILSKLKSGPKDKIVKETHGSSNYSSPSYSRPSSSSSSSFSRGGGGISSGSSSPSRGGKSGR